jgi:hypothetical protein
LAFRVPGIAARVRQKSNSIDRDITNSSSGCNPVLKNCAWQSLTAIAAPAFPTSKPLTAGGNPDAFANNLWHGFCLGARSQARCALPKIGPAAIPDDFHRITATPIKHVVVIFRGKRFVRPLFRDHPNALNLSGETPFKALPRTPKVNNLVNPPDVEHDFAAWGRRPSQQQSQQRCHQSG